ncbi:MAG: cysteine synthase A [Lachnospiraceae bacterium]
MADIRKSATELIGKTPMMEACHYEKSHGLTARILMKLEYLNPAGSIKDRVALAMIEDAERKGLIKPGATIIEPTSGNTGIGIAMVAAARGYHAILTLPDSMSVERRTLLAAYGARLVLTDGKLGMRGAIDKAEELHASIENSIILGQFENTANPAIHTATTGPEIWNDTDGQIDYVVAGVGTGGTVTGIGVYLKSRNPKIRIVAVEPASSPLLSGGEAGPHGLQGIGANFVPSILNRQVIDEIITITEEEAYEAGRDIARKEGILVGITSGAAVAAAAKIAAREGNENAVIVAILPDSGDRYLSTPMFQQ